MSDLVFAELPYPHDIASLFAALAHRPWAMWLDSGTAHTQQGRWDIMVCDPYATLICEQGNTCYESSEKSWQSADDPFNLLRHCLASSPRPDSNGFPFVGGAVGFLAYDLGRQLESIPALAEDDLHTPQMMMGLYDWALIVDHEQARCYLVSAHTRKDTAAQLAEIFALLDARKEPPSLAGLQASGPLQSNLTLTDYALAFARIQHYLREGDCYQVNFAQRFSVEADGDPFSAYSEWRKQSPVPFGAYLNTPFGSILCNSPERFLRLQSGRVETQPMKGTRPRGGDAIEDGQLQLELLSSSKERAENVMIVDLLRNDLAKTCRKGSIHVPELFKVESYATVHQLVSQVIGELEPEEDALSLLRHCFPGGSITGAPKHRAMEIIEELEPHRRGIYCGSILYLGFDGNMDSNIVIRTALYHNQRLYYSAGGGIVSDSECEAEYQETYHKAQTFFRLLRLSASAAKPDS